MLTDTDGDMDKDRMRLVRVEEVRYESPTVRTLIFKDDLASEARAGQFLMVWIPRVDEIPMSVMLDPYDRAGYAALTVRRHGYSSTALYNMHEGSTIGLRGPYGRAFTASNGNVILVGGGTGLVPLLRLCKMLSNSTGIRVTFIMGSRSKDEVIFEDLARRLVGNNGKVIVCTDDGSYGFKGYASDMLKALLEDASSKGERFDMVYTCGPEAMMLKVLKIVDEYGLEAQASLERIMKCGIGLCSSCCIGRYVLCKDGPVMDARDILARNEFGAYARDKSGRLVRV
ncbi:Dihydroorotate dehydrogenase B (NAD(+)), electron transfer subunit [archaeon HR05]|nr:Dihydroorotate dehydrogenase B (NAD(+)), electron transfer subunit [archaeon HR05]